MTPRVDGGVEYRTEAAATSGFGMIRMLPVVSKGEDRLVTVMSAAESMTGPMAMSAVPLESMPTMPAVLFGSLSSDMT